MSPEDLRSAAGGDPAAVRRVEDALAADPERLAAVGELNPATTAKLLLRLKPKAARTLLALFDDKKTVAVLGELDPEMTARLLKPSDVPRVAGLVAGLAVPEAADFLATAPRDLVEAVLAVAPDAAALRTAISFGPRTAGAVMRHRLVAAPQDWTVEQVIAEIRAQADLIDKLYAVYVIDDDRRLVGYLKVRDLLLSPADTRIGSILRADVVMAFAGEDREEVARLARKEHLPVVPVVDAERRLVGMVTSEELRAIDRAVANEDMNLMAGLAPEANAGDGPVQIVQRRLPWLAGGLVGAGIAAMVVGSYEEALTEAAILASLIPIVMSLAGNAGIQASTVTVQALTAGTLWMGDLGGRVLREIGGAILNGAIVGLLVAIAIMVLSLVVEIDSPPALAATAALTLLIVTLQASTVGSVIPIALERLKLDPAVATGVFITTSNDVVGVLIFFIIATTLYV